MGVLPLEFLPGQNRETLGLAGNETYSVTGVQEAVGGSRRATVAVVASDGSRKEFEVVVRVDTPREADYYRFGGILPYVLNQIARG
jgi:aconitate hydratase